MLEKISTLDSELLVFLNGLGSTTYDGFWLLITKQLVWMPFFLLLVYLLYKKFGWKQLLIILGFVAVLILFTDQTANLFKATFQRNRPCNDPELAGIIRIVKPGSTYSFFSGHAINSMATTTFVFLFLRKYYQYTFFVFVFPLLFGFSRIYLGLHFPADILTGYLFGIAYGILFYKLHQYFQPKYFPIN